MDTKAIQVVTPQGLLARVNREWERAEALAGGNLHCMLAGWLIGLRFKEMDNL